MRSVRVAFSAWLTIVLAACGVGGGSGEFPRVGAYSATLTDPAGENNLGDVYIDAHTRARLHGFITHELRLERCKKGKLEIGGGTIEARMWCKGSDREFPIEISGSYSAAAIAIKSTRDLPSGGAFVEERHYRRLDKRAGS